MIFGCLPLRILSGVLSARRSQFHLSGLFLFVFTCVLFGQMILGSLILILANVATVLIGCTTLFVLDRAAGVRKLSGQAGTQQVGRVEGPILDRATISDP